MKGEMKMVPKAGFEPAHPGGRQTLNLVRLPVPPLRHLRGIMVLYRKSVKSDEVEARCSGGKAIFSVLIQLT